MKREEVINERETDLGGESHHHMDLSMTWEDSLGMKRRTAGPC